MLTPLTLDMLASMPRWVGWQTEQRAAGGKPTKVPYAPGGGKARANDASTWGTRDAAHRQAERLPKPFGAGGEGFQLGDLGNGLALGGVDLDSCRDPDTGAIEPWAADVIRRLGSYAEVSPSGTGAKVFFIYDPAALPDLLRVMGTAGGKKWARGKGEHAPAVELYLTGRYFAVTGERLDSAPADIRNVSRAMLERLIRQDGPAFAQQRAPASPAQQNTAPVQPVAPAIEAAAATRPGLARLLAGDFTSLSDTTRSGVAFAVLGHLKRAGVAYEDAAEFVRGWHHTADWCAEKGDAGGGRELRRAWDRVGETRPSAAEEFGAAADAPAPFYRDDVDPFGGRNWLVYEMFNERGVAFLAGQSGAGKTFCALELALSVCTGQPFAGRDVGRTGGVLYLAAEGAAEIPVRWRGIKAEHGFSDRAMPFLWRDQLPCTLLESGAAAKFAALVKQAKAELAADGVPLALIVVDTLATASGWQDENSAAEAQKAMNVLQHVARESGALVLAIDHYGKTAESGIRGSSAKRANADSVVAVLCDMAHDGTTISNRRLLLQKCRGAAEGTTIPFALRERIMGTDRKGRPVKTCTVDWSARVAAKPRNRLARGTQAALDVLDEMTALQGQTQPDGRVELPVAGWRRECTDNMRVSTSDDREARAKAFKRAFADLLDRGMVAERGGYVWRPVAGDEFPELEPDNRTDRTKPGQCPVCPAGKDGEEPDRQDNPPIGVVRLSGPRMPEIRKMISGFIGATDPSGRSPWTPAPGIDPDLARMME